MDFEKRYSELLPFVTQNKLERFKEVLATRTRHLTIVLEDIKQAQNASAVIRSCDCFGIQDLHVIENKHAFDVNKMIVRGSSKWVDVYRYNKEESNTLRCLKTLKERGYKIVATSPHENDYNIEDLPLDNKVALVMGTEADGISNIVEQEADYFTKIPMFGFTESLNLSVCAGIASNQIITRLNQSDLDWRLSQQEQQEILLRWMLKVMKKEGIYDNQFEV